MGLRYRRMTPTQISTAPTIFVHIPKTAGISLTQTVVEQYPNRQHELMTGYLDVEPLLNRPAEYLQSVELITGHMTLENPFAECDVPDPEIITMIRNPVDRVVSLYRHMKRWPEHPLHDMIKKESLTITDLIARKEVEYDNLQTRMLAGLDCILKPFGTLDERDLETAIDRVESLGVVVGMQEHYAESLALYAHHLNWDRSKIRIHTANRAQLGPGFRLPVRKQFTPSSSDIECITQNNALDLKLYEILSKRSLREIEELDLSTDFPTAS